MDKPKTLSVKEFLIRNISSRTMIQERIIQAVVNHQFERAHKALEEHYSLEFSGWGKFYFNKKKARKKMEKLLSQKSTFENILADDEISEQKRRSAQLKLETVEKNIKVLAPKLLEHEN